MPTLKYPKHTALKVLAAALLLTPAAAQAQRLQVKNPVADCGTIKYRQPRTMAFEIKNKSSKRLRITTVKPDCGCTATEWPERDIAAGETFTVRLTYDAKLMGHFQRSALVYTAEPKRHSYLLTIKGIVAEEADDFGGSYPYEFGPLRADLRAIEFDDVSRGSHPAAELHVSNPTSATVTPNILHLPPYLTAEAKPEKLRPGRSGVIALTLNADKIHDFGLTQTKVYLASELGEKVAADKEMDLSVVLLPVAEEMTAAEKANAPHIALTTEDLSLDFTKKKKQTGEIRIANNGKSVLEIKSLQMFTPGLKVTLSKSRLAPTEEATLKITAQAELLKASKTAPRVLMITNDPDKPKLTIRIKAAGL